MRPEFKKPNFFIVGAPKCGTTFLYEALSSSPEIFFTKPKEPMTLAKDDLDQDDWAYYFSLFDKSSDEQWRGDGSTKYLRSSLALERISENFPESRIFVCLRHPLEVAISEHMHVFKKNPTTERKLGLHYIFPYIEMWMKEFPDRLKILLYDDLSENHEDYARDAYDFLNIDYSPVPSDVSMNSGFPLFWQEGVLTTDIEIPVKYRVNIDWGRVEELQHDAVREIEKLEDFTGFNLEKWKDAPSYPSSPPERIGQYISYAKFLAGHGDVTGAQSIINAGTDCCSNAAEFASAIQKLERDLQVANG